MRARVGPFGRNGVALLFVSLLGAAVPGCGGGARTGEPVVLRYGYFPNITHAPAFVLLDQKLLEQELGPGVRIEVHTFNAGPEVVEAIFSNALDISQVGPNPAINGFAQSGGAALRIIAGVASGGAFLVVKPGITTPAQLKGARLATPQLGNTQDVALRAWLRQQGLSATLEGGGQVSILPQSNAQTLETFRAGQIDGAWVPEPWATRLILEGGGHVLVDERRLWPGGEFVTTHVVVRTALLTEHPDLVAGFLRAHARAVAFVNEWPDSAKAIVNAGIQRVTGKALPAAVIERAWGNLRFTLDPIAGSLKKSADDAALVGLLKPVDLKGIYDLGPLNALLATRGKAPISTAPVQ
jgi:NitT/TauT family transport system substrate-binding protein